MFLDNTMTADRFLVKTFNILQYSINVVDATIHKSSYACNEKI